MQNDTVCRYVLKICTKPVHNVCLELARMAIHWNTIMQSLTACDALQQYRYDMAQTLERYVVTEKQMHIKLATVQLKKAAVKQPQYTRLATHNK